MAGARYAVAGLALAADLELPELARTDAPAASTFRRGVVAPPPADAEPVAAGQAADWIRIVRRGGAFVLVFAELARFEISPGGEAIVGEALAGVPEETLRHLLLDHVVPRVLALRGAHVLHASAVRAPSGAIGLAGATGWGKSTLAIALARAGLPLLGDDALLLELAEGGRGRVRATYPGARLWPEDVDAALGPGAAELARPVAHYTSKVRVGLGASAGLAYADGPAPLARLYVLDDPAAEAPPTSVAIAPLAPQQAFVALARHTFRLEGADAAARRDGFERLATSPALAACSSLAYPRDRARLPEVVRAILADVGAAT